ncbi:unnamed protein product [Soboliphyme baturini]|uniref:DNA-directed RNA polymerase I subunit RPA49 n=1 Tax=Soboliphyme baturini TaxID=241478 RepID=A0A183I9A6_9BILA|nr:unnamed protein product [Soboliphyme baturini]
MTEKCDEKETTSMALPKYNPNAMKPEDIYDLSDVVSDDYLLCLLDEANEALKNLLQKQSVPDLFPYITNFMKKFVEKTEDHSRKRCMLVYLNYLIRFSSFIVNRKRVEVSQFEGSHIPEELRYKLIERYTVAAKGRRLISSMLRDSLISHIVLFMLFFSDFKISMNEFVKDAQIGEKRLKTIARLLGCKVTTEKGHGISSLTLKQPPSTKHVFTARGRKSFR